MSVEASRSCFLIDSILNQKPKEQFIEPEDEIDEDEEDECSSSEMTSENDIMEAATSSTNPIIMKNGENHKKHGQDPSPLHRMISASMENKFAPMMRKNNLLLKPEAVLQFELSKHLHLVQQTFQMNVLQNLGHTLALPFVQPLLKSIPNPPKRTHTKRTFVDTSQRSNLKKYRCDVCEKTFSRSNTLITHKRIHTGEKPFKCEHCGRAFRQPGNLTRHRLTHTTVKPYVCGLCDKAFNRASNLHTHMRTHTSL